MVTFQIGYGSRRGNEQTLNGMSNWTQMDAVFRSRLLAAFAASGGRIGFGEGFRSREQQADGYARKPGIVAPPGKSWHEVGMAADIVGDLDWLAKNASRFGLKVPLSHEPWHVTPVEVPAGRPLNAPAPRLSGSPSSSQNRLDPRLNETQNVGVAGSPPAKLPSDMKAYSIPAASGGGGWMLAVATVAPGVNILYTISNESNIDPGKVTTISADSFNKRFPNEENVNGGDAAELATVAQSFSSYKEMWDSIVGQVMGYRNPAKDDPEVLKVLATFAGRPDMTEAELQNRLQDTEWFQTRTAEELEWNSLSEAERAKRMEEMSARMVQTVFQFAGVQVDPEDPRVKNHLEAVASGKLGFGAWTQIIKDQSADDEESPWARQQRDELEAQKQRPIDIENTSQRIRETSERWGVGWSPETIHQWAKQLVEKDKSDEDLILELRQQAQVLYPWKDPETETATAAAPWLETYRRVMEKSATINTPQVQQALVAGTGVFDFETSLKKTDGWLDTKNGQDTMYSAVSEMGARMGFVGN